LLDGWRTASRPSFHEGWEARPRSPLPLQPQSGQTQHGFSRSGLDTAASRTRLFGSVSEFTPSSSSREEFKYHRGADAMSLYASSQKGKQRTSKQVRRCMTPDLGPQGCNSGRNSSLRSSGSSSLAPWASTAIDSYKNWGMAEARFRRPKSAISRMSPLMSANKQ